MGWNAVTFLFMMSHAPRTTMQHHPRYWGCILSHPYPVVLGTGANASVVKMNNLRWGSGEWKLRGWSGQGGEGKEHRGEMLCEE